jgi:hypothetical protein
MAAQPVGAAHRFRQHGTGPPALQRHDVSGERIRSRSGAALFDPVCVAENGEDSHEDRTAGSSGRALSDACGRSAAQQFQEVREDFGRPSLFEQRRIHHHPGKSLAHRVARRRGLFAYQTNHTSDYRTSLDPALPFSFIRRPSDYSRSVAAVFSLSPGEELFGCGESFTRLDKRGQKVVLWANDANGVKSLGRFRECNTDRREP